MGKITGALLDVDGTLVDSNEAHARAWVAALARGGYHESVARIIKLIGMGGDKLLPEVTGLDADSPDGKRISQWRGEIFQAEYLPHLHAFPQTRALLQALRARGIALAVASSAQDDELQPLLRIAGATDLIREQASGSEVRESKPDPDIVQVALEKLGCPAGAAIMLGDTPYDIEAARKAGVRTVALRCGGWTTTALHGAAAVYADPADLLAHLDESPFAE